MAFTLIFGQVAAVSASIAAPSPSSAARLQNTSETSPAATDSAGVEPTANESDPEQTQTPDAATQAATAQAETPAAAPVIIGESETPTADAPLVIEETLTPGTETLTAEPTTPRRRPLALQTPAARQHPLLHPSNPQQRLALKPVLVYRHWRAAFLPTNSLQAGLKSPVSSTASQVQT